RRSRQRRVAKAPSAALREPCGSTVRAYEVAWQGSCRGDVMVVKSEHPRGDRYGGISPEGTPSALDEPTARIFTPERSHSRKMTAAASPQRDPFGNDFARVAL